MLLRENTVKQFTEILASDAPAPGGGSVAALNGALAAALLHMAGELTLGKEKYSEFHAEMREIANNAKVQLNKLLMGIDEDTEAFNKVSAVFSMPKETPEEKEARSAAMQAALKGAALTPLETMKSAFEILQLAEQAHGKTNTSCISDFGTAVLCAIAAVRAAWLNVKINLSGIKDGDFREKTGTEGQKILETSEKLAEELYGRVEQGM
ncbi:MAG: cyclodeaminase/cyclohydrolase family protein [Treponema sp.]|jgi:formiminotetrahydrofolate cyclodeaminase|nr:cyclodeaminase/cyclohydrolase family protein [Treponema sp.]